MVMYAPPMPVMGYGGATQFGVPQGGFSDPYSANNYASMYNANAGLQGNLASAMASVLNNQNTNQTNYDTAYGNAIWQRGMLMDQLTQDYRKAQLADATQRYGFDTQRYGMDRNLEGQLGVADRNMQSALGVAGINGQTALGTAGMNLQGQLGVADRNLQGTLGSAQIGANANMYNADAQRQVALANQQNQLALQGLQNQGSMGIAQLNANAQMLPSQLQQQRFNSVLPLFQNLLGGGASPQAATPVSPPPPAPTSVSPLQFQGNPTQSSGQRFTGPNPPGGQYRPPTQSAPSRPFTATNGQMGMLNGGSGGQVTGSRNVQNTVDRYNQQWEANQQNPRQQDRTVDTPPMANPYSPPSGGSSSYPALPQNNSTGPVGSGGGLVSAFTSNAGDASAMGTGAYGTGYSGMTFAPGANMGAFGAPGGASPSASPFGVSTRGLANQVYNPPSASDGKPGDGAMTYGGTTTENSSGLINATTNADTPASTSAPAPPSGISSLLNIGGTSGGTPAPNDGPPIRFAPPSTPQMWQQQVNQAVAGNASNLANQNTQLANSMAARYGTGGRALQAMQNQNAMQTAIANQQARTNIPMQGQAAYSQYASGYDKQVEDAYRARQQEAIARQQLGVNALGPLLSALVGFSR